MNVLSFLIPISIVPGGTGLALFLLSLRSGQYEGLDGAGEPGEG